MATHLDASAPVAAATPQLPARWRKGQRRKNTAIYWALRAVAAGLRRLPAAPRHGLGWCVGQLAYVAAVGPRRRATQQLAWALPQATPAKRRRWVRRMFVHLAQSALELLDVPGLVRDAPLDRRSAQVLREALAEGRGVVAVGGHLGNWELLAQAVAHAGLPLSVVAKPSYDPRLTAWLDAERRRYGLQLLWRGQGASAAGLLRALRQNRIVALLIDQDTRVPGVFAPFFGRQAHTPSAAATLALRCRTPVVFVATARAGRRHTYVVERVDVDAACAGVAADARVVALTAALNRRLEAAIRARPEQWVWLHRRWRQRPPAPAGGAVAGLALVAALGLGVGLAGAASAAPPAAAPAALQGPLDFRCNTLLVDQAAHTARCRGDVVLRDATTLMCCDQLTAVADGQGQWQTLVCSGHVRLARGPSRLWAGRATWQLGPGALVVDDAPQLAYDGGTLRGRRITLSQPDGTAQVEAPRGAWPAAAMAGAATNADGAAPVPTWHTGALPDRCPLAEAPDAAGAAAGP